MEFPPVSVVMPVRNEERHLAESVRHVLGQDYPGELELVLAVGPSADRTEELARELAAAHPRVTVVANPSGKIPAALNAAVRAAGHQVIARVDGHALLPPGYLTTAVTALLETGAADVGGVMAAEGVTTFARAVAWGMTSKAGVGSAAFHTGGGAGPVDSVYLGVYRREAIEQAGGYDEEMLRAEDWDLNYRIRAQRRPDLVHPRAARHLPAAGERARPRLAVLPLRPLAAGGHARAPGNGQLPLPGAAGRGRAGRARAGGGCSRAGRNRGRGAARRALAGRRAS